MVSVNEILLLSRSRARVASLKSFEFSGIVVKMVTSQFSIPACGNPFFLINGDRTSMAKVMRTTIGAPSTFSYWAKKEFVASIVRGITCPLSPINLGIAVKYNTPMRVSRVVVVVTVEVVLVVARGSNVVVVVVVVVSVVDDVVVKVDVTVEYIKVKADQAYFLSNTRAGMTFFSSTALICIRSI